MAKKVILDVLSNTIGKYVVGLDAESLNVAVWSGKVELNNLQLDVDTVNGELARKAAEAPNLAVPFRVLDGRVQSLRVDVPWARITSRPVVLRAGGLHVFVEPYDFLSGDGGGSSSGGGNGTETASTRGPQHAGIQGGISCTGGLPPPYSHSSSSAKKAKKKQKKAADPRVQSLELADEARLRANAVRKLADLDVDDEEDSSARRGTGEIGGSDADLSSRASSGATFGARLARRIAENLQLEIEDVHVSMRGCGCAAGVVLESLSLVTTDAGGRRTFVDRVSSSKDAASSFLYKALQMRGLGVYLDEEVGVRSTADRRSRDGPHSYILSPLSFNAKLRQSNLIKCVEFPKYLISSELSRLSVVLTRSQLEMGNKIAMAVAPRAVLRPLFPEYRPLHQIGPGTARLWWKYAVRCIGRLNRRRSWAEFLIAFRKRRSYIMLYKRAAHQKSCPWMNALLIAERAELDGIERDRSISVEGLMHWRNIADAQVEREREKFAAAAASQGGKNNGAALSRKKPSPRKSTFMSSFFGSSGSTPKKDLSQRGLLSDSFGSDDDDPPITLTAEEMKELEEMSLRQSKDGKLSSDSMLCDIKFTLGSFKVNLVTYTDRPLASLHMGTVGTSFKANADGSFAFDLTLQSLCVNDMVTLKSLFPTILRSLQSSPGSESSGTSTFTNAFDFRLKKSRSGDQDVVLKMVAFEIIASAPLIEEMKVFFKLPRTEMETLESSSWESAGALLNPMLQETIGGVDLFYDADEGQPDAPMSEVDKDDVFKPTAKVSQVSGKLSSAIKDAWNNKNQSKKRWAIDVDVHAPIVVVPESCIDPASTVLVFNLGSFSLVFGKAPSSVEVVNWFKARPRRVTDSKLGIDYMSLEMKHLSFVIGKAGDWTKQNDIDSDIYRSALNIIEPITLSLHIGIESTAAEKGVPRTCIFGVLPAISCQVAPSHVTRMLSVAAVWRSVAKKMKNDSRVPSPALHPSEVAHNYAVSGTEGTLIVDEPTDNSSNNDSAFRLKRLLSSVEEASGDEQNIEATEYLHVSLALRRLSAKVSRDVEDGAEAHLMSVVMSSTLRTDGSSSSRLCMGCFWILDRLIAELPRNTRLLVHSNLPGSAASYSHDDSYKIMEEVQKQSDGLTGASDLADITLTKLSREKAVAYARSVPGFSTDYMESCVCEDVVVVDAAFTSLFVNWNPQGIKNLLAAKDKVMEFKESAMASYDMMSSSLRHVQLSPAGKSLRKKTQSPNRLRQKTTSKSAIEDYARSRIPLRTSLFLSAKMNKFEISLNSARDDKPLFTLVMADSQVRLHLLNGKDEENIQSTVVVGDFRMETPEDGKALGSYKILLGLAPSATTSLLTINYSKGSAAVKSCKWDGVDMSKCEACADIVLSPMRFVHIHSQVFTLIEYVTEGVFGAIAAKVASSAAVAAFEAAQAICGEKLFRINATGFDFVLPEAAYSPDHFAIHAGNLLVHFVLLANAGGGRAHLSLGGVSMRCSRGMQMVENPIKMTVGVALHPNDAATEDDRATRVDVSISEIYFILAKCHYSQIMKTLDLNIGERDSFLRVAADKDPLTVELSSPARRRGVSTLISHSGVASVEIQKRMYIKFAIAELGLELCGATTDDPIISMAAVESNIELLLMPDLLRNCTEATLHNVFCEDRRLKSINRYFRNIFTSNVRCSTTREKQDVFNLSYTKWKNSNSMDVVVKVGSPQIILLPDVISDLIEFSSVPSSKPRQFFSKSEDAQYEQNKPLVATVGVVVDGSDGGIEASFCDAEVDVSTLKKMKVLVHTSDMKLVFVDMGSGAPIASTEHSPRRPSSAKMPAPLTETVVLHGKMNADLRLIKDAEGATIDSDYQIHGERLEIYSAQGEDLEHPVQILEPAKFSIFYSQTNRKDHMKDIEIKAVTLSPIDITFSMQNAALLSAISSSISDSFAEGSSIAEPDFHTLTDKEAFRIERLASALEKNDGWEAEGSIAIKGNFSSISANTSTHGQEAGGDNIVLGRVVSVKLTLPEARLTVLNDLQGLDEALFKVAFNSLVFGGEIDFPGDRFPVAQHLPMKPVFDFHVNTAIVADYFDAATNMWETLLTKPWELTFKGSRGTQKRFKSSRMSTTFDIESHPCYFSFSEHFLVSLGAASRMWSVYSGATKKAVALANERVKSEARAPRHNSRKLSKSMAAHAARSLIVSLPYAVENHSGVEARFAVQDGGDEGPTLRCPSGTTQYFRFKLCPENGVGGKRVYGQDVRQLKSVTVFMGNSEIKIQHLDAEVNKPRNAHHLGYGRFVFTNVVKNGLATILHISSAVDVHNTISAVPFKIFVLDEKNLHDVGICASKEAISKKQRTTAEIAPSTLVRDVPSHAVFGIPSHLLQSFDLGGTAGVGSLSLQLSPLLNDSENGEISRVGTFDLPPLDTLLQMATGNSHSAAFEVLCSPVTGNRSQGTFAAQIFCKVSLVDDCHPFIELFIQPRLVLENRLPVRLLVRTPMPHTFSDSMDDAQNDSHSFRRSNVRKYFSHMLKPFGAIEVCTPGPSIAVSAKCADEPIGGTPTGWLDGGWVDVPLGEKRKLSEPIRCMFPFTMPKNVEHKRVHNLASGGSEFFICEAHDAFSESSLESGHRDVKDISFSAHSTSISPPATILKDPVRSILFTVLNVAVDHTGILLFERVNETNGSYRRSSTMGAKERRNSSVARLTAPFGAYSSNQHRRRITLLPGSRVPIRLVELTMNDDDGTQKSLPFRVEDISLTEGADATPIFWQDNTPSGYYAYRHLSTVGSEVHVIPEYVIYNGSTKYQVTIKQLQQKQIVLDPEKISTIHKEDQNGIILTFTLSDRNGNCCGRTGPCRVDLLGLKVCMVKSVTSGSPIGSLAIQTVIGARDSRLVIKIGSVKLGKTTALQEEDQTSKVLFAGDFLRFRVRWSEMRVTLNNTDTTGERYEKNRAALNAYLEHNSPMLKHRGEKGRESFSQVVAQILLHRFTVDYQRIFKDDAVPASSAKASMVSERSQFSVVIHNIRVTDCSPNTPSPVVFDSSSEKASFFDLCIRTRGPLTADLVKVDLFDLNLAYSEGKSETIVVNTSEEFVWRLLDVANRTATATAQLAGVDLELDWDENSGVFHVSVLDSRKSRDDVDQDGTYSPPRSDKLYDVKMARVSPFRLLLSFKRQPQTSRYRLVRGVRGAKLTNYFTTRLKFTIDRAELRFKGYAVKNVKGPPDRLVENIRAVYTSQLKSKMVTLMSSASIQDWKYLTAREEGDEDFVEGDILRLTGNLAGRSAGYILKKVGDGIGDSVSSFTGTVGSGIQDASEKIGVGFVGAGVNSVVSGIGDGVGSTVKGVGKGAGNVFRGSIKGIGQVAGGVGGGVQLVAKGIGKGVVHGDGQAILTGLGEGATSIGTGVGQGVETAVMGTADGVMAVGQGLFTGVKNVGKGIGGVFLPGSKKKPDSR